MPESGAFRYSAAAPAAGRLRRSSTPWRTCPLHFHLNIISQRIFAFFYAAVFIKKVVYINSRIAGFTAGKDFSIYTQYTILCLNKTFIVTQAKVWCTNFFQLFYHLLKQLHIILTGRKPEMTVSCITKKGVIFIFEYESTL